MQVPISEVLWLEDERATGVGVTVSERPDRRQVRLEVELPNPERVAIQGGRRFMSVPVARPGLRVGHPIRTVTPGRPEPQIPPSPHESTRTMGTVSQASRAERYPQASSAIRNRLRRDPSRHQVQSAGVPLQQHRWEWRAGWRATRNVFSKQKNCFLSPSARETWSFLDRRRPPRKCRLKECSPGETWYTLIWLGEMAPTLEPSRNTLRTPPSPIAGLRRRPRPSRDAARTITRVGNAGQIRFGARHNWMVAPTRSPIPGEASPPLVAATTSALSRSWFTVLSYIDRRRKNRNELMKLRLRLRQGAASRAVTDEPNSAQLSQTISQFLSRTLG